jgi:fatty-acyl-CoA synthase
VSPTRCRRVITSEPYHAIESRRMALPLTPLRFLERAINVFGSKTGVVCGEKEFTYARFGRRCGQLATALASLGVRDHDRVAYLSFNTHKLLEGYYGVIQAGAIVMPLNVRLALPELINILNHAEPAVLLFEADFAAMIPEFRKHCTSIRIFVALDAVSGDQPEDELQYEDLLAAHEPAALDIFRGRDEETAELFYTSGSTGSPKGVMLSHRALYQHAFSVATLAVDPATSVDLHTIPLFHANGWGRPQASTMLGITQVMVRRFDPVAVLQLIGKVRATDMSVVPTMANALLNVPNAETYDVSSMRQIQLGGAASSPALVERMEKLFRCEVFAGYGLTESCPVLTMAREKGTTRYANDAERWQRRATTGWSLPGVHLRVVDYKMQDVTRDSKSIGEIIASCDWLMTGYYKDPIGTNAVLTGPHGEPGGVPGLPLWLHTGDMATWDEEEFLVIVDRRKEIIISGGENISSLEIEKHIGAHPAVFECAVVAAPDPQWGEIPVAVVVLKTDARLTKEELLAFLCERLSRFKLPRRVDFVLGPLPKTGTGKIKKMEIREPYWAAHEKRIQG